MDGITAQWLQRLGAEIAWAYALRVALALAGVMALGWATGREELMVPLLLGALASALAETDDSWRGRAKALVATLACFGSVALAIAWLAAHPIGVLAALLACSFVFTLLGAVGGRYRAIAAATVILALYAALSEQAEVGPQLPAPRVAALLLAGAVWYGLLSVFWAAAAPLHPVRHALAALYLELAQYLNHKAALFEPVRSLDVPQRRLALAQSNARVVAALNSCKDSLLARMRPRHAPGGGLRSLLHRYFIAQDIHERASASHYPYGEWTEALFHSDVPYRCQRTLLLQAQACEALAEALRRGRAPQPDEAHVQALADLHGALAYLQRQDQAQWRRPLRSLGGVARNLDRLGRQLGAAFRPDGAVLPQDIALLDQAPHSLAEAWARVRAQLQVRSALFRHAVRLSLALAAAWAAMQLADPSHGYWIMLTTLIVCQPTYGATVVRLAQRIGGTVLGLLLGWALLRLFPQAYVQALLALGSGVLFFLTRTQRYVAASVAVTVMVLMLFHQGDAEGDALIVARLLDTVVGAAIAAAALLLVLPDWQGRRLGAAAADALQACARYLEQIMLQHAEGREDDLDYRVARRAAHNADAALSATLGHMLREPPWVRRHAEAGTELLVQVHALLGYLSALAAHRELQAGAAGALAEADRALAEQAAAGLQAAIGELADSLRAHRRPAEGDGRLRGFADALDQAAARADEAAAPALLLHQLAQACRQMQPLRAAAARLVEAAPAPQPRG
ncbi:putative membrane protein (TIGR01666 family) [Melaminivora alkalimesophila]|uniref:Putative membrane protein (TIGR01666 family) n=2 Tax=Melaminivora alkalimesophila TaxID=1165852 RepID=A0A317RK75_9BURK|nr:YccS family putative transporter [Melaminivora alkalimesophila]PWW48860.1 putative membrane protein (TIGR01666 family) [Melaminivora alkalimesophila]